MYKHQTQWEDELWIVGLIILCSVWYLYTYDTKADALMQEEKKSLQNYRWSERQHIPQGRPSECIRVLGKAFVYLKKTAAL